MNKTIEDLITRRSCRKYKDMQIKDEELNLILEAGTYAPTGKGLQSPKMVVVQDKETIRELSRMNAAIMGKNINPFYGAPTIVIVFADKNNPNYIYDGSLVMGNLMNAAHALNVGSCWINRAREVFETPEGKDFMKKWGISDNYAGIGNCILGYEEAVAPARPRKEDYIVRV